MGPIGHARMAFPGTGSAAQAGRVDLGGERRDRAGRLEPVAGSRSQRRRGKPRRGAAVDRQGWRSLEAIRSPDLVGAQSPQGRLEPWDAWHLCRPPGSEPEGRACASGPGLASWPATVAPRGLNRPLPDRRSGDSGAIRVFLNPRAAACTIGLIANSAGATLALALRRRARDRGSTLGSRAP
jgi:hypothetical protein